MTTSQKVFTMARLGRKWTHSAALECLAFFGAPYSMDWKREREFAATHATDYEPSGYTLRDNIRHAENAAHGLAAIYDNGGETCDRYTLYLADPPREDPRDRCDCLCMSDNPGHPQGFSQFSSGYLGLHNGSFIGFTELPDNVQRHALARLAPCGESAAA